MSELSQQLVNAIKSTCIAKVQEILAVTHDDDLYAITTPVLHHALDNDDIFSLLIKRKFNLDIKDDEEYTILVKLIRNNKHTHVKLLLKQMITHTSIENVYNELFDNLKNINYYLVSSVAACYGMLDLIKWCHENNKLFNVNAMVLSAKYGHVDTLLWLHENRNDGCTTWAMNRASQNGYLDIVKWLHVYRTEGCTSDAMDLAAANGHLDIVEWLHENRKEGCTSDAMDGAANGGHLNIVKWLHEHGKICSIYGMKYAVKKGYLDIVKYIYENVEPRSGSWTSQDIYKAIKYAKECDKLDIVTYLKSIQIKDMAQQLVSNIKENCMDKVQEILDNTHDDDLYAITTPVLHHAIDNLEMFSLLITRKFNLDIKDYQGYTILYSLFKKRKSKQVKLVLNQMIKIDGLEAVYNLLSPSVNDFCFSFVSSIAAQYGILNLIEWCHENNKPFHTIAMNFAAENGYLDVVKYLDKNRTEGCTHAAMNGAANNGHLDIVRWLHENRKEECTFRAMDLAAMKGYLDVVKYLYENRKDGGACNVDVINCAAGDGHLDIVKWLHERGERCSCNALTFAAENGYLDVVRYLYEHVVPITGSWTSQNIIDTIYRVPKDRQNVIDYLENIKVAQQLVTAIESKCIAKVQEILDNTHDDELYAITTPVLHHAIDDLDIFSLLVKRKFNLCVQDNQGFTVLVKLLACCKHAQIKLLLDQMILFDGFEAVYNELSASIKNYYHVEAEYIARYGRLDFVKWCHENNKPFNDKVMAMAAAGGHLDIVKWLYENCPEKYTLDVMKCAAMNGELNVIKWLHAQGKECTAIVLDVAAMHGHLDTVKWIHETDKNDGKRCTIAALQYAAWSNQLNVVKYIYENCITCTDPESRQIIDDIVLIAKKYNHVDIVKYFNSIHIEKIEQEYFDTFSLKAYDNFVNDVSNSVTVNHAEKIVDDLLTKKDADGIIKLIELPRYADIDAIYLVQIIHLLVDKKQYTDISKILEMSQCEKIDAKFVVYTAIDIKNYDLITQFAKKYKDDTIDALVHWSKQVMTTYLPKEQMAKYLAFLLSKN